MQKCASIQSSQKNPIITAGMQATMTFSHRSMIFLLTPSSPLLPLFDRPKFIPVHINYSKYGSELNDYKEHLLEAFRHTKMNELIHQKHMTRTAYRKPFGNALNYSEENNLQVSLDIIMPLPSIIIISLIPLFLIKCFAMSFTGFFCKPR